MSNNRFQRGHRPVFICATCGRSTRLTGQGNDELCAECWELAGLENSVLDGTPFSEIASERDYLVNQAVKRGGNLEQIRKHFSDLYPNF